MIIDTHCHYNVEPLLSNAKKHWQNSLSNNVVGAICIGTDIKNSKIAINLAQKFNSMFVSIAIHPEEQTNFIKSLPPDDFNSLGIKQTKISMNAHINNDVTQFKQLLLQNIDQKNNKIIAIGEIGLDYYRLKSKGLKRELAIFMQKQVFLEQLKLAFNHNLPVILHVRDHLDRKKINAYYETYHVVKKLIDDYQNKNLKIPPIILHCASGPKDYIKKFLSLGAYFGFGGNVTYANAPELKEIFKLTPKNKVLLETDAPYLAPTDKKGELCEPHFITKTAKFLQHNYQLDLDIILQNTVGVFPQFKQVIKKNV